jgi:hypothetical protein
MFDIANGTANAHAHHFVGSDTHSNGHGTWHGSDIDEAIQAKRSVWNKKYEPEHLLAFVRRSVTRCLVSPRFSDFLRDLESLVYRNQQCTSKSSNTFLTVPGSPVSTHHSSADTAP